MPQTEATRNAVRRDGGVCLWCFYEYNKISRTYVGHHLFGRRFYDREEFIVALCDTCHHRLHQGLISNSELVSRVMIPHVWGGQDLTPREKRSGHEDSERQA